MTDKVLSLSATLVLLPASDAVKVLKESTVISLSLDLTLASSIVSDRLE